MKSKKLNYIVRSDDKFGVDAQWQLTFNFKVETILYLLISVIIILLLLIVGFIYLQIQYYDLKNIQDDMYKEMQHFKKLKQELKHAEWFPKVPSLVSREKRENPARGKRSIYEKPSKLKKIKKDKTEDHMRIAGKIKKMKAQAIHLERDVPYIETANDGIISHWSPPNWADSTYALEGASLENNNSSLVIQRTGLYLIYAQLCYAKTRENNGFEVKVMNERRKLFESKIISQCSAGTSSLENEVTCYTSVVQVLQAGDHVYLQQTQRKRHLLMNKGRSFMGVIKFSD